MCASDDAGPFGGAALARIGHFRARSVSPGIETLDRAFGPLDDTVKRRTDLGTGAFLDANRR